MFNASNEGSSSSSATPIAPAHPLIKFTSEYKELLEQFKSNIERAPLRKLATTIEEISSQTYRQENKIIPSESVRKEAIKIINGAIAEYSDRLQKISSALQRDRPTVIELFYQQYRIFHFVSKNYRTALYSNNHTATAYITMYVCTRILVLLLILMWKHNKFPININPADVLKCKNSENLTQDILNSFFIQLEEYSRKLYLVYASTKKEKIDSSQSSIRLTPIKKLIMDLPSLPPESDKAYWDNIFAKANQDAHRSFLWWDDMVYGFFPYRKDLEDPFLEEFKQRCRIALPYTVQCNENFSKNFMTALSHYLRTKKNIILSKTKLVYFIRPLRTGSYSVHISINYDSIMEMNEDGIEGRKLPSTNIYAPFIMSFKFIVTSDGKVNSLEIQHALNLNEADAALIRDALATLDMGEIEEQYKEIYSPTSASESPSEECDNHSTEAEDESHSMLDTIFNGENSNMDTSLEFTDLPSKVAKAARTIMRSPPLKGQKPTTELPSGLLDSHHKLQQQLEAADSESGSSNDPLFITQKSPTDDRRGSYPSKFTPPVPRKTSTEAERQKIPSDSAASQGKISISSPSL